jgi:hypothetical protein
VIDYPGSKAYNSNYNKRSGDKYSLQAICLNQLDYSKIRNSNECNLKSLKFQGSIQ